MARLDGNLKLIVFNETAMEKPLSDSEVDIIVKQHEKKDWGYKCNDQPMCSLCDKQHYVDLENLVLDKKYCFKRGI